MVDEATEVAPVESPPMKPYEHAAAWQAHEHAFRRIAATVKALREQVGPVPRELKSRIVVDRVAHGPRYQVYFPDLGVAGAGRCACEASLEAVHALEVILESVLAHKDWKVLPAPDRSLRTALAAAKTGAFLRLRQWLDSRLSAEEARSCKEVQSDLDLALAAV